MGILGLGCDIVVVTRVLEILKRRGPHRLASRILSKKEMSDWQLQLSRSQVLETEENARFLAVRWAVKEASYKALYPDFIPTWREITYRSKGRDGSKPSLAYTPPSNASTTVDTLKMHCSVSHDGPLVFATVIAERLQRMN
ncbi:hypothetical protein V5O48_004258 [Marasmius crinis-equi]|uniref:4'-phosphopantetheinyl transferase domain-containing protein n=1 Tax=Marasmius crinis-equi TaxID=585013 RepID=A0ABR3FQI9_9AGAR